MKEKITEYFKRKGKEAKVAVDENKTDKVEDEIKTRNYKVKVEDIKDDIRDGKFGGLEVINFGFETCAKKPVKSNRKEKCRKCRQVLLKDHKCGLKCKFCDYKTKYQSHLIRHVKKFHPDSLQNLLNCQVCDSKFTKKGCLKSHMKTKHQVENIDQFEQFECDFCGKIFRTKGLIYMHLKSHLPNVECPICDAELKFWSLKTHLREFHATKRNFHCKICSKSFKSKDMLHRHVKTHDKKFECQICSRKFPSQSYLNQHQRNNHENPGSFSCEFCDKKCNTKGDLKKHQKYHDYYRPKPFKCQKCRYSTDIQHRFKNHQKTHEKQEKKFAAMKNPLKCEKCGKFSRNKYFLKYHIKAVHPDEPWQCDLCGKYIKTFNYLKKHLNNHLLKMTVIKQEMD